MSVTAERVSTIVVFWIQDGVAQFEGFDAKGHLASIAKCEALRASAKAGAKITHICMSADFVENVGLSGVSDKLPEDYNWVKRRHDGPVGRPSGLSGQSEQPGQPGQPGEALNV